MVESRDKTDLHEDRTRGGLAYVIVRKPNQDWGFSGRVGSKINEIHVVKML